MGRAGGRKGVSFSPFASLSVHLSCTPTSRQVTETALSIGIVSTFPNDWAPVGQCGLGFKQLTPAETAAHHVAGVIAGATAGNVAFLEQNGHSWAPMGVRGSYGAAAAALAEMFPRVSTVPFDAEQPTVMVEPATLALARAWWDDEARTGVWVVVVSTALKSPAIFTLKASAPGCAALKAGATATATAVGSGVTESVSSGTWSTALDGGGYRVSFIACRPAAPTNTRARTPAQTTNLISNGNCEARNANGFVAGTSSFALIPEVSAGAQWEGAVTSDASHVHSGRHSCRVFNPNPWTSGFLTGAVLTGGVSYAVEWYVRRAIFDPAPAMLTLDFVVANSSLGVLTSAFPPTEQLSIVHSAQIPPASAGQWVRLSFTVVPRWDGHLLVLNSTPLYWVDDMRVERVRTESRSEPGIDHMALGKTPELIRNRLRPWRGSRAPGSM